MSEAFPACFISRGGDDGMGGDLQKPLSKKPAVQDSGRQMGQYRDESPSNEHGIYQANIVRLIPRLKADAMVITEYSIQTTEWVKLADVAFASAEFMWRNRGSNPYPKAQKVCVEMPLPSNTA